MGRVRVRHISNWYFIISNDSLDTIKSNYSTNDYSPFKIMKGKNNEQEYSFVHVRTNDCLPQGALFYWNNSHAPPSVDAASNR